MADISIIKKISLFREYKKSIKRNLRSIESVGLRIDKAERMYTVINIPEELIGEAYALKKSDIDRISENYIREYISEISKLFFDINLNDLASVYDVKKVDKYSYLIIFGFSLFKSNEYYDRLYLRILPIISALALIGGVLLFLAM